MGSAAVLATVSSSNHVGREDLTFAAFDFLTAKAVVHWRNHPGWNEHIDVADIPRYIDTSLFKLCSDASHLTLYSFDE